MQLAFYLAAKGGLIDKLIALKTRGRFSHVELVFDEKYRPSVSPAMVRLHDPGGSLCYSSSMRAPRKGCGFQNINLLDGKWVLCDIAMTEEQAHEALRLAVLDNGRGYDLCGDLGFIIPFFPNDGDDRFCSQECVLLMQDSAGLLPTVKALHCDPNTLAKLVGASI